MWHVTPKTNNAKLGPIVTTTADRATCPRSCPFIEGDCYAELGRLALHWGKIDAGERGVHTIEAHAVELEAAIRRNPTHFVRLHQAGDFADTRHAVTLARAIQAGGGSGWTYTHRALSARALASFRDARDHGLVVNASCHTVAQIRAAHDSGMPAVMTVPADTAAGRHDLAPGVIGVVCPQQTGRARSCLECGAGRPLCARADRGYAILFRMH